jgi:hypothetical protein
MSVCRLSAIWFDYGTMEHSWLLLLAVMMQILSIFSVPVMCISDALQ